MRRMYREGANCTSDVERETGRKGPSRRDYDRVGRETNEQLEFAHGLFLRYNRDSRFLEHRTRQQRTHVKLAVSTSTWLRRISKKVPFHLAYRSSSIRDQPSRRTNLFFRAISPIFPTDFHRRDRNYAEECKGIVAVATSRYIVHPLWRHVTWKEHTLHVCL